MKESWEIQQNQIISKSFVNFYKVDNFHLKKEIRAIHYKL